MVFNEFIERLLQESDKFPLKTLLVEITKWMMNSGNVISLISR